MKELTRRQALCRITALIAGGAVANFTGCRKQDPVFNEPGSSRDSSSYPNRKRRLGTFEETAKAFIMWLGMNGYNATEPDVNVFADAQPFEPDAKLIAFALDTASGKLKEYSIVKDGYILEWVPAHVPFVARINKAGKAGKYEILSLADVFGPGMGDVGGVSVNIISNKKRILVFESAVESEAMISRERISGMLRNALPQNLHSVFDSAITKENLSSEEFEALLDAVGASLPIRKEKLRQALLAFRLMPWEKDISTEEGKLRAMSQCRTCTLTHEITHSELGTKIPINEQEEFCFLAEIAFCPRSLPRLGALFIGKKGRSFTQHELAMQSILAHFRTEGFDESKLLSVSSGKEVRKAALRILDDISIRKLKKPFAKLVDVSLYQEVQVFAESVN